MTSCLPSNLHDIMYKNMVDTHAFSLWYSGGSPSLSLCIHTCTDLLCPVGF